MFAVTSYTNHIERFALIKRKYVIFIGMKVVYMVTFGLTAEASPKRFYKSYTLEA